MADYEFLLYDNQNNFLKSVKSFYKADYTLKENDYTPLEMYFFPSLDKDLVQKEFRIEILRHVGNLTKLQGETQWLIRYAGMIQNNGADLIKVIAYRALHLAKRRRVPYNNGTAYTLKQAPGDDVIKAIFRENGGALTVDTARIFSGFTVGADVSLAPQITKTDFSMRTVLEVIQEIANDLRSAGTYLCFDVVKAGANLEFRTYMNMRGNDHSSDSGNSLILSQARGNLLDVSDVDDGTEEQNFIYAASSGVDDVKAVETASNAALIGVGPFARIEGYVSSSGDDADEMQADANAALASSAPKHIINGKIVETAGSIYDVHYGFGDIVGVEAKTATYDAHVDTVHVTVDRDSDTIESYAKVEL